jgi:peptide methionine sulfoxide reductase MsrA
MEKTYSPVKNYIIKLNSILQNDKDSINIVAESLKTRGYSFIRLHDELVHEIDISMMLMESFFLKSKEYKTQYFKKPIFGYFGVDHKESFRLLTGTRMNEHKFPENLDKLKSLIQTVDQIMYSLSLMLAPSLFPNLLTDAKKHDIPFFDIGKQWGMFDIAKYQNDGTRKDINCKEHYDPGLLSLSLRSTQPGLQLLDEFGKWIKTPEDNSIAILWAGKAATRLNSKIKPGVHRVVVPDTFGKPRIAMWHEICTNAQEHKELIKQELDKKVTIDPYKFEGQTGIPMSKSMAPIKPPTSISQVTKSRSVQPTNIFPYIPLLSR